MPPRTYTDPAFGARLRHLREQRGMSLRDLSRQAFVAKSTISELENGAKRPSAASAHALDSALGAGGQLEAMVTPAPTPAGDRHRIGYATAGGRVDTATVAALAGVLAAQRRLDDTLGPHPLAPAVGAQWPAVMALARDARGPAAGPMLEVAAEWTQFVGWLHAESRQDAAAVRVLTGAAAQADAIGHGPLKAQAVNFLGYAARQRRRPREMLRHFHAAYETPGASVLQRAGDAAQAAHALALLGEHRQARTLLGAASDLVGVADGPPPGTAYWLTPGFSHLNVGLAYAGLGDDRAAADHLRTGLESLPPDQQASVWSQEYRGALAAAGG